MPDDHDDPGGGSAARLARVTVWLTGRPASGKTTIAAALGVRLAALGADVRPIDGDELRRTISRDLGFSREDRAENVRRAAHLALAAARDGKVAVVSLVSPYASDRDEVRRLHREAGAGFVEVYVACPLAVAEARDPKGHYRRARAGEMGHFTGIDDPYEPPAAPEVSLDTSQSTLADEVEAILAHLRTVAAPHD